MAALLRETKKEPKMKTKHAALLFGSAIVLAGAIALGSIVWGGVMTVAATDAHYAPVQWALETTMESSVRHHAADVAMPSGLDLSDPALAERAFGHYDVACTPCHGAPGVEPAPWLVLNPPAEPLVETADQWSDEELYWIIANGIKMTGMPALGPTHGDDDLWAIAAMVRQLPTMTPAEYQAIADRHATRRQQGGHAHEPASMERPATAEPSEAEVDDDPPATVVTPEPTTKQAAPAKRRSRPAHRRPSTPEAGAPPTAPAPSAPPEPPTSSPEHHEHHHHHHHEG